MGDTMWVNGINLLEVNDELKLHEMVIRFVDYTRRFETGDMLTLAAYRLLFS